MTTLRKQPRILIVSTEATTLPIGSEGDCASVETGVGVIGI